MQLLRSKTFAIILCLVPLIPVWYFDYLPLQDYPNHFARLQIQRSYEGSEFYREHFTFEPFRGISPIPNLTLDIFVNSVFRFLDIESAMRLFVSLYIVLYLLGLYLLTKELGHDFSLLLMLNLPLMYSVFFHLGLLGFIFSIPIFLLSVYVLGKYEKSGSAAYIISFSLLSLFLYITHIISFFALVAVLICCFFAKKRRGMEYVSVLLAISPPVILTTSYLLSGTTKNMIMTTSLSHKLSMLSITFSHLPSLFMAMSSVLFIAAVFLILRNASFRGNRFFYAAVLIFTVYLILPFDGLGGSSLFGRPFLYSLILLSLSINTNDMQQFTLSRLMLTLVILISTSWHMISFADFNRNFSARCAPDMQEKSRLLSVDATRPEGRTRPYLNAWGYFTKHREFIENHLLSGIQQQIKYVDTPRKTGNNRTGSAHENNPLAVLQESYDYILFFGNDPEAVARLDSISQRVCADKLTSLYKITK